MKPQHITAKSSDDLVSQLCAVPAFLALSAKAPDISTTSLALALLDACQGVPLTSDEFDIGYSHELGFTIAEMAEWEGIPAHDIRWAVTRYQFAKLVGLIPEGKVRA